MSPTPSPSAWCSRFLFDYNGIINFLFHTMGTKWIDQGAPTYRAMIALCVYIIWQSLPFKILIFLSGLRWHR
jgi:ABC-type sugar transport system permease subunit